MTSITADRNVKINASVPNTADTANLDIGMYHTSQLIRSLVHFDLSSIPSTATVTSAVLKIYDSGGDFSNNDTTGRAYRVRSRAWTESGTWNNYDGTNAWGTAGCDNTSTDREATDIGNWSMPAAETAGYKDVTLTTAKVQEWIDGTFANNGLLLKADKEDSYSMHRYQVRTAANPPKLEITYTLPSGAIFFGTNI